jgi:signal transduction histidine kinase
MDDLRFTIVATKPTPRQRHIAFVAVAVIFVGFAVVAPFGAIQLQRIDSFVPVVEGIICLTDLVTAVLLFGQFATSGSPAVLVLASGYLFTALIVIPHILSFPGGLTPMGIFGVKPQAPPWLYTFWYFGFAAAVLGYAYLKKVGRAPGGTQATSTSEIRWTILIVVGLVCALTIAVTAGHEYMPSLISDEIRFASLSRVVAAITLSLSVIALAWLWMRKSSVLDLWLMVVVCALIAELAVNTFVIASRFSVGFYSSRVFSVLVSTIMLIVLLWETTKLYTNLSLAVRALQRERNSGLMNVQAVIASIAHEVRQPLTAIASSSAAAQRFLRRSPPDTAMAEELMEDIKRATSDADQVFESIRGLFREGEQGSQPVDLNEVALEVLRTLSRELEGHGIFTRTQLAHHLAPIMGHRGQLREVVLNLVQNAIDAMAGTAQEHRELNIKTERSNGRGIALSIADSGPGIDPEKIDQIFDAFVTTKSKGMGLGLAISKMIIERHGGQISAASGSDIGTRIQVVLPIHK